MLQREKEPVAWKEEARLYEYQTTTNDLDLQGKTHHSICRLEQLEHSSCQNQMDDNNL